MDDASAGRQPLKSRLSVLALVLLTVASVAAGVTWWIRGPQIPPQADATQRVEVRTAAERFAREVTTFEVEDLDEYVERVEPLLTEDLAEQFTASTDQLLAQFAQTKVVTKGTVTAVAIDSVDSDSAEALVSLDVETTPADVQYLPPRLRWQVSLLRQGDRWLVDRFAGVDVRATAEPGEGDGEQEDGQ